MPVKKSLVEPVVVNGTTEPPPSTTTFAAPPAEVPSIVRLWLTARVEPSEIIGGEPTLNTAGEKLMTSFAIEFVTQYRRSPKLPAPAPASPGSLTVHTAGAVRSSSG